MDILFRGFSNRKVLSHHIQHKIKVQQELGTQLLLQKQK